MFISTKVGRHVRHVIGPEQVAQLAGHGEQLEVARKVPGTQEKHVSTTPPTIEQLVHPRERN